MFALVTHSLRVGEAGASTVEHQVQSSDGESRFWMRIKEAVSSAQNFLLLHILRSDLTAFQARRMGLIFSASHIGEFAASLWFIIIYLIFLSLWLLLTHSKVLLWLQNWTKLSCFCALFYNYYQKTMRDYVEHWMGCKPPRPTLVSVLHCLKFGRRVAKIESALDFECIDLPIKFVYDPCRSFWVFVISLHWEKELVKQIFA